LFSDFVNYKFPSPISAKKQGYFTNYWNVMEFLNAILQCASKIFNVLFKSF